MRFGMASRSTPHQGSRNRVPLTPGVDYRGATVVHNHPDDVVPSARDLVSAKNRFIGRLVVVTPKRRFLVEPEDSWPDATHLDAAFQTAQALAQEALDRDLANRSEPPGDAWATDRLRRRGRTALARALRKIGVIMKF